jgi:membrane-associated phospholipid phosphatase
MNPSFEWGLELIRTIQRIQGPTLNTLFKALTALGSEDFYFLLLPLLLWCIDFAVGARLAAVFLLSAYVNVGLKDLFRLPRPFVLDPSVRLYDVEGYGMPSGHAQLSVVIWGTIAHALKKTSLWILAGLLAALIGLSRIYLGVHFPTDVAAGWLIGALLLAGYVALHPLVETWLEERGFGVQVTLAVALSLALLLFHATEDTVSLTGILLGAGVGLAVLRRHLTYHAGGPLWKRGARLLLGSAIMLALRFGLKAVSPEASGSLQLAFRFVRYAVLGVWISLGAPWMFNQLRLVADDEERTQG